jgi:hypothetical protein
MPVWDGCAQHVIGPHPGPCEHSSAADFRFPYEWKTRAGYRSRGASKELESRMRHRSPYSRGPHEFKVRMGFGSRDMLRE